MSAGGPPVVPPTGAVNPYSPPASSIEGAGFQLGAVPGFKSASGLANAIAVVLGAEAIGKALVAVNAYLTIGVMERISGGEEIPREQLVAIDMRSQGLAVLGLVTLVAAAVLFCIFMVRANRNARSFGATLANTPGWAAGWFFVPFASLWKPYYAMKEIWQGSDAEAVASLNPPVPALLPLWWWAFILHNLVGGALSQGSGRAHGPEGLISTSRMLIVSSVVTIVAAVLAIMVAKQLARRQDRRASAAAAR